MHIYMGGRDIASVTLADKRVQKIIAELERAAASWEEYNPGRHLFMTIQWKGRYYVGKVQYRSNQGTSTVAIAIGGDDDK